MKSIKSFVERAAALCRHAFVVIVASAAGLPILALADTSPVATGGTITSFETLDGVVYVHTFTQSGTFAASEAISDARLLVVGGGGSGGVTMAGGGGGGGFVEQQGLSFAAGDYAVTVGAGGVPPATSQSNAGLAGSASSLIGGAFSFTAPGGGGGGSWGANTPACTGGSTGGGGNGRAGGILTPVAGVSANIGGTSGGSQNGRGGGGGGAGSAGANGADSGNGGEGLASDISGETRYYAAGGGGGASPTGFGNYDPGVGGSGVGGEGGWYDVGGDAVANTGSGGGGGGFTTDHTGGKGADGVVIVRYRVPYTVEPGAGPLLKLQLDEVGSTFAKFTLAVAAANSDTSISVYSANGGDSTYIQGAKVGERITYAMTGLAPKTTYGYEFFAMDGNGEGARVSGSFTTEGVYNPAAAGGAVTDLGGGEMLHVFTKSGTLTVPEQLTGVRLLLVGGGGSGGVTMGGGGGGGGVLPVTDAELAPGVYTITVGKGGARVANSQGAHGANGEASSLVLGDSTLYTVSGGGGGGSWGSVHGNSPTGASAGGSASSGNGGTVTPVEGVYANNGGKSGGTGNGRGGGGGGAMTAGADGADSGNGGDGYESDITGVNVTYGGGGGGGAGAGSGWGDYEAGVGGVGGGGNGGKGGQYGFPGVNGLGGGGGGGGFSSDFAGGKGGDGTVIIRYTRNESQSAVAPIVSMLAVAPTEGGELAIDYDVSYPGDGQTGCAVTAEWWLDDGETTNSVAIGTGLIGKGRFILGNLPANRYVNVRVVAANGTASSVTNPMRVFDSVLGAYVFDTAITVDNAHQRLITVSGTVKEVGAGAATVELYLGPDAEHLEKKAELSVTEKGPFSLVWDGEREGADWSNTYVCEVRYGNPEVTVWSGTTKSASFGLKDSVVYTWTGAAVETPKRWCDPANWSFDQSITDCAGFPDLGATAILPSGVNEITVDESVELTKLDVSAKNATNVLTGVSGATITVTTIDDKLNDQPNYGGTKWNTLWKFDNVKVVSPNTHLRVPQGGAVVLDHGAELSVYQVRMHNWDSNFNYDDGALEIRGGSTLTVTDYIQIGGLSTMVIDDATVVANGFTINHSNNNSNGPGGGVLIFRGANPVFRMKSPNNNGQFTHEGSNANMILGGDIVFNIPAGGYAEPPIQHASNNSLFSSDKQPLIRFAVDPESAAFAAAEPLVQILATNGFNSAISYKNLDYRPLRDPEATFVCSSDRPNAAQTNWTPRASFSGTCYQLGVSIPGGYLGPAPEPEPESAITGGGMPGLHECWYIGNAWERYTAPTAAEENAAEVKLRPDYAFVGGIPYKSTVTYSGYMYLKKGRYTFYARYDDRLRVTIDGSIVVNWTGGNDHAVGAKTYTTDGWRKILVTMCNNDSSSGPVNDMWPLYYRDQSTGNTNIVFPTDPGDGTVFRTQPPNVTNAVTATLTAYPSGLAAALMRTGDLKRANVYAVFGDTRVKAGLFEPNAAAMTTDLVALPDGATTVAYEVVPVSGDGVEYLLGAIATGENAIADATPAASTAQCELVEATATAVRFRITVSPSGKTEEVVVDGLTPGAAGTTTISATIDGEEFAFADQPYATIAIPAAAPAAVNATVKRLGANTFVYTFLQDGSITIPEGARNLRALVVAGGGAGGRGSGGGGGAGGMLDQALDLAPGVYTIIVGKGGEPSLGANDTSHAGNGGDSSLDDAQGVPVLHAVGGGGGGSASSNGNYYPGWAGGSGGGFCRRVETAAGVDGQGFPGGAGIKDNQSSGGGGGGAGAPGGNATSNKGGNGGDGRISNITGEDVWYAGGGAGGGGAGTVANYTAVGGKGGGASNGDYPRRVNDGVDGLGGGGAGGHDRNGGWLAGKGGSGVVIVRFDLDPEDPALQVEPIVEVTGDALVKGGYSLAIDYTARFLGTGATSCDLELVYGFAPDDLAMRQPLCSGVTAGGRAVFTALVPGRTYYYAVKATNDRGFDNAGNLIIRSITLPEISESVTTAAGSLPGLWQARFEGAKNWTDDILSSPTRRREPGPVMASVHGNTATTDVGYTSPIDGVRTSWADSTTFGYQGVIYLRAGQTYTFASYIDDYAIIKIDGQVVSDQENSCDAMFSRSFIPDYTGWHAFEVRLGNATGTAGGNPGSWGFSYSIAYTTELVGFSNDGTEPRGGSRWTQIMDRADGGALLRTAKPGLGIETVEVADKTFRITLGTPAEDHEYALYACYGAGYGGEVPEDWETMEEFSAADGEIGPLELTEDTRFVRFFTRDLMTGDTAGAKTITLAGAFKAPSFGELAATADLGGNSATFSGTAANAATVTVYYRGPNDLVDKSVTADVAADGTWSIRVPELATATTYTYYLVATAANGANDRTEPATVTTPGEGAFGSSTVFNNFGKDLRFHYGVTALGAGANTMTLSVGYYRNGQELRDDYGYSTVVEYVDVVVSNVTALGSHDIVWNALDSDFDWLDTISWKLTFASTADDGTAFVKTATGTIQLYDPNTYTWVGAEGGDWSDPANWSSSHDCDDPSLPGYPDFGAKVVFPSSATVAIDGAYTINGFTLSAGTAAATNAVTFVGEGPETSVLTFSKPRSDRNGNGYRTLNGFTRFEADGVTLTCDGSESGGLSLPADSSFVLDHRAVLVLHQDDGIYCNQKNTRFEVRGDAAVFAAYLDICRQNAWVIIDDGHITLGGNGNSQGWVRVNGDYDSAWKSYNCGIEFRGDHPELICGRFYANGNTARRDPETGMTDVPGHVRFYVPAGGYRHSPIREKGCGNQVFSNDGKIDLEIMADSPALAAAGTTVSRLVDWPYKGITGTAANKNVILPAGYTCSAEWKNLWKSPQTANSTLFVTLVGEGEGEVEVEGEGVGDVVKNYGPYQIHIFTNVNETAYFTLDEPAEAEVLLVGGGGAGGYNQQGRDNHFGGGGGGAGGFVSKTLSLAAGVYPIRVGRGGNNYPSAKWYAPLCENGLDTTAFGLVAYGGGAGGSAERINGDQGRRGANGGSGGGNTQNNGAPRGLGVEAQGNAGGGTGTSNYKANGGGGAGADAVTVSGSTWNTDGGDGLPCDITGTTVWYAGGGGGGGGWSQKRGALGGKGGGGRGGHDAVAEQPEIDGVDGLGGGGGGSAQCVDTGNGFNAPDHLAERPGGRGGNGVVIVRIKTGDSTTALREAVPTVGGAVVYYEDFTTSPSTVKSIELTGYGFNVATNYTLNGETIAFTTLGEEPGDVASLPGLYEAHFSGKQWTAGIVQTAAGHRELGPLAANNNKGWYSTTEPGRYCSWGYADTYGYAGYMFMEQGKTYSFGGYFDNCFRVSVNGTTLWETGNANDFQRKQFTPPKTGWYPVDFRFYHSSGDQGARGNFAKGLAYTTDPDVYTVANSAGNSAYSTGWLELVDPGDGSLFRTYPPVDRTLRPQGVMRDAAGTGLLGTLVSETAVGAADAPDLDVWAVTGDAYLDGATTNEWIAAGGALYHVGTFAADASSLAFKLANVGAANYVRFVGFYADDTFGERATWSETVFVPSVTEQVDATPVVSVASVTPGALVADIAVNVLSAGGDTCDVFVKYGLKPDALAKEQTLVTGAPEGVASGKLVGLKPNRTYYAAVYAICDEFTSAVGEPVSFTTAELGDVAGQTAKDGRSISVTEVTESEIHLAFGPCAEDFESDLYCLIGPEAGDAKSTNGWNRLVKVAEKITAADETYVYTLPAGWGTSDFAVRFAFGDTAGGTPYSTLEYYVSDGLVCCLDGIDNAGTGEHDPNAATWVDLAGNGHDFPVSANLGSQLTGWTATSLSAKSCYDVRMATPCSDYKTIEIVAKHNNAYQCLFNSGDGLMKFVAVHNGKVQFYSGGNNEYLINDSVYLQAAATYATESSPIVYVNGALATQNGSDGWGGNNTPTCLGRGAGSYQFTGEYYAIRLYDRVLTPEEIAANAAIDEIRFLGGTGELPKHEGLEILGSSETVIWTDPSAPSATAEVSGLASGCEATFTGTAKNAASVTVSVSGVEPAVAPVVNGAWTVTVTGLTPAQTYTYTVTATGDGDSDVTAPASFTMPGAAVLSQLTTVTRSQRHITLTGTLTTVGAGTNVVTLLMGTTTANLAPVDCRLVYALEDYDTLTPSQPFTLEYDLPAFGGTYYFGVRVENACFTSEAGEWTKDVANTTQVTANDDSTYTWTGGSASMPKVWSDPANWNCSSADRWDYPANRAKVAFPAGMAAVDLDTGVTLASWTFAEGAEVTIASANGSTLTVSGHWKQEQAAVIALGEGLNAVFNGDVGVAANGAELVVSNATLTATASGVFFDQGGVLRIAGERPLVKALRFRTYAAASDVGNLVFTVPVNGYVATPIQGGGSMTENLGTGGGQNLIVSIDPASPAVHADTNLNVPLLAWNRSYSQNNVNYVRGIDLAKVVFTTEWPDNDVDYGILSASVSGPWYKASEWTTVDPDANTALTHGLGVHVEGTLDGRPILRYPEAVAIGPDSVTLRLKVVPGAGTDGVSLKAVVWPTLVGESAAVTNDIAFVTAEDDAYLFTMGGLAPETAYRVQVHGVSTADETDFSAVSPVFNFTTAEVDESSYYPSVAYVADSAVANGDMTFTFDWQYINPGYSATGCAFTLEYWHDGLTNTVPLAGIDIPQQIRTVTPPLKPNTTYGFRVKAVNDLDPARVSYTAEQTLATDEEKAGATVADSGFWTNGTWAAPGEDVSLADGNVFRGLAPTQVAGTKENSGAGIASLVDGVFGTDNDSSCRLPADGASNTTTLQWLFDTPQSIDTFRFYTHWGDNRAQIVINDILVTTDGTTFTSLPGAANFRGTSGAGTRKATFAAGENKILAEGVTGVQVVFACTGSGADGWKAYREVQALAHTEAGITLTIDDYVYDGATLQATISREGETASDVYACYGATYGGDTTNGWANVVKLGTSFREGLTELTVATVVPAGTKYVRFFSAADGWSESLYVGELDVTADPQVKLAALTLVETAVDAAALSVDLNAIGTDATGADLYAVYSHGTHGTHETHGTFVYTNQIGRGVSELGTKSFALPNLKPDTQYQVYVYADNGLAGGYAATEPIAFTTGEEGMGSMKKPIDAGAWVTGNNWTTFTPAENNLILGKLPSVYTGKYTEGSSNTDAAATDGEIKRDSSSNSGKNFGVGNNCVAGWTLDEPSSISELRFYTVNWGNRDQIKIDHITATVNGAEVTISPSAVTQNGGAAYAYLKASDGMALVNNATAVTVYFGSGQQSGGVHYGEIEVIGEPSGFSTSLTVEEYTFDGTVLTTVLTREGDKQSDLYACYGATYGGAETNGWESVVKVGAFPAGVVKAPGVVVPTGARYVRFFSERDGWSETFFLPELPIAVSDAPIFGVTAVTTVRETSARFTGYLAGLGEGATGVEIIASYGETTDASDDAQTILTIDTAAFDPSVPLDLDLLGLTPNRRYYVRFHAVNDRGVESVLTEAFEITTIARGTIGAEVLVAGNDPRTAVQCETRDLATGERVLIFGVTTTNDSRVVSEPAVFTVTTPGYAEVLVVGGGGGTDDPTGSYAPHTGGGAGGLIHYDTYYFGVGTYTIDVGRGALVSDYAKVSAGSNWRACTQGNDTIVTKDGEEIFRAYKGGNGGRNGTGAWGTGPFGSGCGYTNASYTPGQGYPGGAGIGSGINGGGGGAGERGHDAWNDNGTTHGGDGGDGLLFEITGEPKYYAGGGGSAGGNGSGVGGLGGLGGGGMGAGTGGEAIAGGTSSGVDGTGGGAGGSTAGWAHGGSGTVILRFVPEDESLAERPVVQLSGLNPKNDANDVPGVDIAYRVVSEGDGRAVSVDFEYGVSADNLDRSVHLEDAAYVSNYEDNFTGLRANLEYFGCIKVTDEQGTVSRSRVLKFVTLDGDDSAIDPTAPRFGDITCASTSTVHQLVIEAAGTNFVLGAGTTAVRLLIGTDPLVLTETNVTVAALSGERLALFVDGLDWDVLHYACIEVDNGAFVSKSPVFTFAVTGQSVLMSSTATVSAGTQKTLVFSGIVKSLGVGETVAKLYLSTVSHAAMELAQTIPIVQTGYFEFAPVTFEWDQTAYYRIDVENTFLTEKWTSSGVNNNKGVYDYASYTWIPSEDDGEHRWTDPANWVQTSDHAPGKGYPSGNAGNSSNTATFPATDYEYFVDIDGANVASASVTVSEGAKVRFRSKTGNGWTGVSNGGFNWQKGAVWTLDGSVSTYGQNMGVSMATSNTLNIVNGSCLRTSFYSHFHMNAAGVRVYVDETSQLGPFSRGPNDTSVFGGTDSAMILEGLWQVGIKTYLGANKDSKGVYSVAKGVFFCGPKARLYVPAENIYGSDANSDETTVCPLVFEIPLGGYDAAPVDATISGALVGGGSITVVVPTDAPVVLAETDGDYQLVSTTGGINTDRVVLAALPHPDTDYWYWTYDGTDAREGTTVTGLGVHIVGRPFEPTAPVARILHVDDSTESTVTFAADLRCGGSSTSATWSYRIDDAADWTAIGTFTEVENFKSFTVGGLEKGTQHVLHLKGVSEGGTSVTDYAFGMVGDWATLDAVEGVAATPYGPYTRIANPDGTFKVLVACEAEATFDDGTVTNFLLNTGTYAVKGGALLNEAGVVATGTNATALTLVVLTREVKNEPLVDVTQAVIADNGDYILPLDVFSYGGEITSPETPPTSMTVALAWGYHPDHLVYTNALGTVALDTTAAGGATNLVVHGLPSSTFFYAKVVADNGEPNGVGESQSFVFASSGFGAGDGVLYQAVRRNNSWYTGAWDVFDDDSRCQTRGPMAALYGSNCPKATWTDANGDVCATWGDYTTFCYVGYMYFDEATYAFAGGIDDSCSLKIFPANTELTGVASATPIDNKTYGFSANGWNTAVFTPSTAGWYPVEIRAGNGTGGYGPYGTSGSRRLSYNTFGITKEGDPCWMPLEDPGDGSLFSTQIPSLISPVYDEAAPFVSNVVADVSAGDALKVSCTAERAESFAFFLGSDSSMSDWVEVPVSCVSLVPSVSLTFDNLTPGTNFYLQVAARGADGKWFASGPMPVRMPAASSFATDPSVSTDQDAIIIAGGVKPGAGETTVLARFKLNDGEWSDYERLAVFTNGVSREPWKIDVRKPFDGAWNAAVGYEFSLSNATANAVWTTAPVVGSATLTDVATYTWIATSTSQLLNFSTSQLHLWNDPSNWSCDKERAIGYPTETSTAKFTAAAGADVVLDQDRTVKTFTINAGARIVFSGPFTFTAPGTGDMAPNAAEMVLGVRDRATFRYKGAFFVNSTNETILVDNGTFHVNHFFWGYNQNYASAKLVLAGAAPKVITQGRFGARTGNYDYTIRLVVPEQGWREPLIESNGLTEKVAFAAEQNSAQSLLRFEIDPSSPFLRRGVTKKMKIVDWSFNGFKAERIALDGETVNPAVAVSPKLAKTAEMNFNKEDDPSSATLLFLKLRGIGGTAIIIR